MVQLRLDQFIGRTPPNRRAKLKCPICGREFTSRKGLCIHVSKAHNDNPPLVYPNEGVSVATHGSTTEVRIRMKRKLWDSLRRRAMEENTGLTEFLFEILVNASAYGREYGLWTPSKRQPQTAYIT